MNFLKLSDEFQKLLDKFMDFLTKNYSNPILWISLFLGGLLVFNFTYNALKKEK